MTEPLRDAARLAARVLRRAANMLDAAAKTQTWVMKHPRRDMVENLDERHYAAQYLHWLDPLVAGLPPGGRVLDLGCGHGRLALEVAAKRPDCSVVGVDLSPPSVRGATTHAASRGLVNCQFLERDLVEYLRSVEADSSARAKVDTPWPSRRNRRARAPLEMKRAERERQCAAPRRP